MTAPPLLEVGTSGAPAGAAGTGYSLGLSSSVGSAGGPAYNEPILTAHPAVLGETSGAHLIGGWSCGLDAGSTALTCTSSTPIPAGTALAGVTATVDIPPAASADLQTTVSLSTPPTWRHRRPQPPPWTRRPIRCSRSPPRGSPAHAPQVPPKGSPSHRLWLPRRGPCLQRPDPQRDPAGGGDVRSRARRGGWSCALNGGGTVLTCGSSSAPIAAGRRSPR